MCGIYGYIGEKNASEIILDGLKRLDYRGYDSWGIAVQSNQQISVVKDVGKINDIPEIKNLPVAHIGIGHTRWATHGAVTQTNAHPHFASDKSFVLAQNGIVENYEELKSELVKKGYRFISQTDTEVIVHLIEEENKRTKNLKEAVRLAFLKLKGRNTVILLSANENEIIAARNGSPLVVGLSKDKEIYFSSDTLSFAPYIEKMVVINNGELVQYAKDNLKIYNIITDMHVATNWEPIAIIDSKVDKEGYAHFMLKEIYETPQTIANLTHQDKNDYEKLAAEIKQANTVYTLGSGTTGIAAAQIAFYLRSIAKIKAISLIGADAQEYYDLIGNQDLVIVPSQSGETADVLEVLEIFKKKGVKIASFVNMPGSMITKLSDYRFMIGAGPEICVMSTKVFTAMISWGYIMAKTVIGQYEEGAKNLLNLAEETKKLLVDESTIESVKKLAVSLAPFKDIFLLGKYENWQIMREAMVKLIEGTYKHAHAIPAGDLKHYAITLIEKNTPVLMVFSPDEAIFDLLNAANEVKARGAQLIAFSPEYHEEFDTYIQMPKLEETSAILNIIPFQLLAYYMAVELGNNIDKPRNIAKSVTVK